MRVSSARPIGSTQRAQPAERPERAPEARPARRIDPDLLYREITAPHADMSALIVDPRPDRVHPLLRQEVEAMRLRAKLREPAPVEQPRRRPPVEHDTLPEASPAPPPALRQRETRRASRAEPNRPAGGTVVERTDRQLPGAPTSSLGARRATPPSTAALHSAVRGNRLIGRGYQGREVIELQTLLRRRGFNVAVNGAYDAATEAAVRVVQRRAGLAASGTFDTVTMAALEGRLTAAS